MICLWTVTFRNQLSEGFEQIKTLACIPGVLTVVFETGTIAAWLTKRSVSGLLRLLLKCL